MPVAYMDTDTPPVRYPRTIFEHAHIDGVSTFPANLVDLNVGEIFMLMPDNFNGLDGLYLWLLGSFAGEIHLSMTLNIATCSEAFNTHTQTVNNHAVTTVVNAYKCVDLTTIFATVLANLTARDMIWLTVQESDEDGVYLVGLEVQES